MHERTIARPTGTSWASVLGGWLAAVGTAALAAPAVGAILAGRPLVPNDLALAVPVVAGLMTAYFIGGYVAGRMAGRDTSWHGMMAAFFGLFVTLLALLFAALADQGSFAALGVRSLVDVFPGIQQLDLRALGDTLTFGAVLGFLATIFAGWLGGVLAPESYLPLTAPARPVVEREVVPVAQVTEERVVRRERPRFRLLPVVGRKGGEPAERKTEEEARREASTAARS